MKKKANKKGFTIMEMLIVVAIIAVLAAIAIPTFNSALTKSKQAADVANVRAAYAEVVVAYLSDGSDAVTSQAQFEAKVGDLNFPEQLELENKAGNEGTTVTYTADKLEKSPYTWDLPMTLSLTE